MAITFTNESKKPAPSTKNVGVRKLTPKKEEPAEEPVKTPAEPPKEEPEEVELSDEERELAEAIASNMILGQIPNSSWGPDHVAYYGEENRTVIITGEVGEEMALAINSQLLELNKQNKQLPITVFINSGGGDCISGLGIFDTMKTVNAPIITIVAGLAGSMALLLAAAGDIRLATKNSMFFYHQIQHISHIASPEEMQSSGNLYARLTDKYRTELRDACGIKEGAWEKYFANRNASWLDTSEAIDAGLIHKIVQHQKKDTEDMKSIILGIDGFFRVVVNED